MIVNGLGKFDTFMVGERSYGNFSEAISMVESPMLDPTAIIQLISRYHFFGDRTVIKSINKSKFFYDSAGKGELPPHGYNKEPVEVIGQKLYQLLREEIAHYISGKTNIGVLLSGGMDSRIVAGILRNLQLEDGGFNVTALTWGIADSRDVHYAAEIADVFGWSWKHYALSADVLAQAVDFTSLNGAEFSPIHLHAMHKIREEESIDVILAGSYGDSIGRGEYSGRHITNLKPIDSYVFNWFGLVRGSVFKLAYSGVSDDVRQYRDLFPREQEYQHREVERQCHYMRRMLNPCMAIINQKIPVRQVFSDPKVFGYVWNLHPTLRGDEIYEELLGLLPVSLSEVSWARTGRKYGQQNGAADALSALNNHYGDWIRREFRPIIHDAINGKAVRSLGLFNTKALDHLFRSQLQYKTLRASKVDEILIWMVSLSRLIERFNVSFEGSQGTWKDNLRSSVVPIESRLYAAVHNRKYRI